MQKIQTTIDAFLDAIQGGDYHEMLDAIFDARWDAIDGKRSVAEWHRMENQLPLYHPIEQDPTLAILNVHLRFPWSADDAMWHFRSWSFVKGYYTNCRGNMVMIISLGETVSDRDYRDKRAKAVKLLNQTLQHVRFTYKDKINRGLLMSDDPMAFIREDSELKPFNFYEV